MGLSFAEIGIVLLVALIVIGPDKLPKVAKSIGKGYAEFKRAFNDLKRAADINNVEVTPQRARDTKSVYKSRWEAEALEETPHDAQEVNKIAAPAAEAETKSEPAAENKPVERAKRSDLIKEVD
ncbi:MAG: twin-arginine translocase TatA/TatE family subunit [Deferribacteraceae bacterium]|jgi:TatA/E family protein of Tat protein translocase|nr:twin-arginine translocase TatA/TatE family subunit [Deferribacteraceae bacterium]